MSHASRARAERALKRHQPRSPRILLSENLKTGHSINLPILNCQPTERCAAVCYATAGPISWNNSLKKALAVDAALRNGEIEGLIWECRQLQSVRLSGSGDLCGEHLPAIYKLAESCPQTIFWGFTRSLEIAEQINHRHDNLSLILSIDATSADQELPGFTGPLAFGPILAGERMQPVDEIRREPPMQGGATVALESRPWSVGGHSQRRQLAVELLEPIGSLSIQLLALEPLALPHRIVRVLDGDLRERQFLPAGKNPPNNAPCYGGADSNE